MEPEVTESKENPTQWWKVTLYSTPIMASHWLALAKHCLGLTYAPPHGQLYQGSARERSMKTDCELGLELLCAET